MRTRMISTGVGAVACCHFQYAAPPPASRITSTAHGKADRSLTELAEDPEVVAAIQQAVDEVNEQFAQVEQIKRFTLLGEEWLPDTDVLTPTSKLKRRGIHARYANEIEAMYS